MGHFSKYTKYFLLQNKRADEALKFFKIYIYKIGRPKIFQSEFRANIIKHFLWKKILFL